MTYVYDSNGNIVSKTPYTNVTSSDLSTATKGTVISYGYGDSSWSDKLTSYDGQTISYDESGNPTSYKGNAITWNGRLMTSYEKGERRYEFAYNSDGMRTVKRAYENGELIYTYTYVWDGDVLLGGRMEDDEGKKTTVRYLYDDSGELYGMDYNGAMYVGFIKNLQGDIVSIVPLDSENDSKVNIEYDAWGKPIIKQGSNALGLVLIALVNSVSYRGYFYDYDTGLYYLRSRYYDPETGRFINADDTAYLGYDASPLSMNLFAYCENNPVNYADICGYSGKYILKDEISLIEVERSAGDYVYKGDKQTRSLKTWKELAYVGASSLSHIYPNGVKFYKHCLKGEGQVLAYNYIEAFNQDQQIRQTMISYFFELKNYVTKKYGTKTNYIVCRDGYFNVECSSKDWQLALNSHQATISAHIVYNSSTKMYETEVYVLAIDLYNFNKYRPFVLANNKFVKKSVAFAIQKTGQFIETGLAHDFYSYGIAIFKVKWKAGGDTLSCSYYFSRR